MNFSLVDVFKRPYEAWEYRKLSFEEVLARSKELGVHESSVKTKLISNVQNHFAAASYMLMRGADNALESHVENELNISPDFSKMLGFMPEETPVSIVEYKHSFPSYCLPTVLEDIERFGRKLHEGQTLFHGGFCSLEQGESMLTDKPLSTSFCPQVALRNAEWKGKAYDAGEVHLLVLRITGASPKAFVFPLSGELGNEKEVLIAAHIRMTIMSKTLIRNDYDVCKVDERLDEHRKFVPAYVLEVDVVCGR